MDLTDPATFARVYDEHARGVHATAQRVLLDPARADDVTQDVFLRLWRNPRAFDAARGALGAYLRLMARSRAVDLWREAQAAGRATDRLKLVADRAPPPDDAPDHAAELDAERRRVRAALRTLPQPQREAVVLTYWGGLSADEVARRAGVPVGTAKSRIRLGMVKLRAQVGEPAVTAA